MLHCHVISLSRERTSSFSILVSITLMTLPLGEWASGELFDAGGFYASYGVSVAITLVGILYILALPETLASSAVEVKAETAATAKDESIKDKLVGIFRTGNRQVVETVR